MSDSQSTAPVEPVPASEQLLPIGTRIQFLKTLECGPDDYSPGNLYAVKGEFGTITGHGTREGYWAKWDGWPHAPFGLSPDEFRVADQPLSQAK